MDASKKPKAKSTEDRIIAVAKKLFAAKGYEGTSTKEICQVAKVNIAAIHYHFESKEGLLRRILENFGEQSLRAVQRILIRADTKQELKVRLKMFLEEMLDSYLEHPEVWQIVQSEAELMHKRSKAVFQKFFIKRTEKLVSFFVQAKKDGILSKDTDPFLAARSLFSQVCHQARLDNVYFGFYKTTLKNDSYRALWIKQTLQIFVDGISK